MTESLIDYDGLVQQALRNVVREILLKVGRDGLQGDHHFYIAFRTRAPGVRLPQRLLERYPEEMTIVIQHRFWDLNVRDADFDITLSFNQRPEVLTIPFQAIVGFVDPSVQFALQFQDNLATDDSGAVKDASETAAAAPAQAGAEQGTIADRTAQKADAMQDNVVTLDAFRKKP